MSEIRFEIEIFLESVNRRLCDTVIGCFDLLIQGNEVP